MPGRRAARPTDSNVTRRRNSAVVTRQFDPGKGWTLEQARDLYAQGYGVDHITRVTGFPQPLIAPGRGARGIA